jgi:hypothetical protein
LPVTFLLALNLEAGLVAGSSLAWKRAFGLISGSSLWFD